LSSSTIILSLSSQMESKLMPQRETLTEILASISNFFQSSKAFQKVSAFVLSHSQAIAIILTLKAIWWFINHPLIRIKPLEDVGYISDGKQSKGAVAAKAVKKRKAGDELPLYPNGWYPLIYSHELKPGDLKTVSAFGEELLVFRGEKGTAAVLDAYCPHNGAHIGMGGTVVNCMVQCPFHGWEFDQNGKCTGVPEQTRSGGNSRKQKSVPLAPVKAWVSKEINQLILVWYHAEEEEPTWYPREYEELQKGIWRWAGLTENFINCHIQEIPENGADIAHLNWLHTPSILRGTDLRYIRGPLNIIEHGWKGEWKALEGEQAHVAELKLTHELEICGWHLSFLDFHLMAHQEGPGLVTLTWNFILGKGAFVQTLIPEAPLMVKLGHTVWMERSLPNIVGRILLMLEVLQVDRDIMIWNHKKHVKNPHYLAGDKSVKEFRAWYKQFYSADEVYAEKAAEKKGKNSIQW